MLITPKHTIEDALSEVKKQLFSSVADKNHIMRYFAVSTVDTETNLMSSRMVVMREFESDWTVKFYTDYRTSKVRDLLHNRRSTLLFWDPSKNLQVRIKCDAVVHHQNTVAREAWKLVQGEAQKSYSTLLKPGSPISTPDEAYQWPDKTGSDHFALIECIPVTLQILQLNKLKHLALKFVRIDRDAGWKGGWIVP